MTLTRERLMEVVNYNADLGTFTNVIARSPRMIVGSIAGGIRKNGYYRIAIDGKRYYAHRLAWLYVHGVWPADEIDHINGNRSDNRIENLRAADRRQNLGNQRRLSRNTSGYKGVSWCKARNLWVANIQKNGKLKHLGRFPSAEAAHQAYSSAAKEYFGEFANEG